MNNPKSILYVLALIFSITLLIGVLDFYWSGTVIVIEPAAEVSTTNTDTEEPKEIIDSNTPTESDEEVVDSDYIVNEENDNDFALTPPIIVETETEALETDTEALETEVPEEDYEMTPEEKYVVWRNIPLDAELQYHIFALCDKYEIQPEIIFALIQQESCFRDWVIGDKNQTYHSYGLMQIKKYYVKAEMKLLGCSDLLNPYDNTTVGIYILKQKIDKYERLYPGYSLECALREYNKGSCSGVEDALNARYVQDILRNAKEILVG